MQITINIREHYNKIVKMLCEQHGVTPEQIDKQQIKWYVQKDIKWWLEDSEDNQYHQLMDGLHNFRDNDTWFIKRQANPYEKDEFQMWDGEPSKIQHHWYKVRCDEGKGIWNDISNAILNVKGVLR